MSGVSGLVGRRSQAPQGVLPGRSSSSFDQLVVVGCADGRTSPPCCSIFTAGGDVARGLTRQAAAGTLHTSSLRRACFCSLAGRLLRRRRRLREAKIVRAARAACCWQSVSEAVACAEAAGWRQRLAQRELRTRTRGSERAKARSARERRCRGERASRSALVGGCRRLLTIRAHAIVHVCSEYSKCPHRIVLRLCMWPEVPKTHLP